MGFAFEQPIWLWLLAGVPLIVFLAIRWFGAMSLTRRWSVALARVAFIALVAGVLAGANAVRPTNKLAVIAVIDVSESVRAFASTSEGGPAAPTSVLDSARAFLARAQAQAGPDDELGVVVFSGDSAAVALPGARDPARATFDLALPAGTDLGEALRFSAALLPPDASGRLVLFSDGVETQGDVLATASGLVGPTVVAETRRASLPVDVVPFSYDVQQEVLIEAVDAPPRAPADSAITIRVTLRATEDVTGTLRLLHNDVEIDLEPTQPGVGRRVSLRKGVNVELARNVKLRSGRVHRFRAFFEPDVVSSGAAFRGDTLVQNNEAEAFTIASGRGSVLLVDGVRGSSEEGPLASALRRSGLDVSVVTPDSFPASLLDLQAYDLIVLENVPADEIARRSHQDIANHVHGMGAGLVMVGGNASFGAGGWKGTDVEPLLPVKLELPESMVVPETAVVFVLDNSGSMGRSVLGSTRSQQQIANDSAALAVLSLDERDLVGVVSFNSDYNVVVPLSPNTDPRSTAARIRSIPSGGGTRVGPALAEAGRQLRNSNAKVRHVIVLSDGRSQNPENLPQLATQLSESGITVSTIAVGDEADRESLQSIATRGRGTYYEVVNPAVLPRLLLRAVRIARSPMIREGLFDPIPINASGAGASTSPLIDGLGDLPPLGGLALTQAREDPLVTTALVHPEGEPVLAHWQAELGRVVAFTSDAHDWASQWLDWPGYQTFWTEVARWSSRPADAGAFQLQTRRDGDRLELSVESTDPTGAERATDVDATVYTPSGGQVEAEFVETGPGIFQASVPARESGNYITVVKPRAGDRPLPPVIGGTSLATDPELRTLQSNRKVLEDIAAITGGRVLAMESASAAGELFDRSGLEPTQARSPLWRSLLIWAVVILLLDVGTRRVAWDRLVSREFGADLRKAAREATQDRSAQATTFLSTVRSRAKRAEVGQKAVSEDEVTQLKAEQKAKRRARKRAEIEERMAKYRSESTAGSSAGSARDEPSESESPAVIERKRKPTEDDAEEGASGLLAAKRRARRRYETEDQESESDE